MGVHKTTIPFSSIDSGYKKTLKKQLLLLLLLPPQRCLISLNCLNLLLSKSGLDEEDGNERIQFNCAAGRGEFRCCT